MKDPVNTALEPKTSDPIWETYQLKLPLRIGGVHICSPAFRASRPQGHFTTWVPKRLDALVVSPLPDAVDLAVVRSFPIEGPLPSFRRYGDLICYAAQQYTHYFTDLTVTNEEFLAALGPKSRATLKRKARKFFESWPAGSSFRVYKTPTEMQDFYDRALCLSQSTYQERLLKAGLPNTAAFVAKMLDLSSRNSVRAFLLEVDSQPIAYLYLPADDGILMYSHLGYEEAYSRWSPGSVLQLAALEYLIEEGVFKLLDFEEGEGQHKRLFATHSRRCSDLYLFPALSKAAVIICVHYLTQTLSRLAGSAARRLGLHRIIKRALRVSLVKAR